MNFRRAVLERPWRSRSDGYTGLMRGCLHPSEAIYMTAYSALKSATLGSNDCVICTIPEICYRTESVFQITTFYSCTFLCRQDADVCATVHR